MPMWTLSAAQKFALWEKSDNPSGREILQGTEDTPIVIVLEREEDCEDCPEAPVRPDFLAEPDPDYVPVSITNGSDPDVVEESSTFIGWVGENT